LKEKKTPFISTQVSSGEYYYLNLIPEKDEKEVVVCGGREQCAPAYRIARNSFKFHCIEFVSSGRGTLTLSGKTCPLRPGAIFCYGPNISHVIQTDPDAPLLKHFVDFTGRNLIALLKATEFGKGKAFYVSRPFRIRSIFESLIETGNTDSFNRDALCALLVRQLMLTADDNAIDQAAAFSPAWQTYLRCRQYIEKNALLTSTISQVAAECFLDQAYLARLFKRFSDESPLQLLTRLKMGKAAELLSNRELLIKQVAEQVGFTDPYHFSRTFKRVYGIPPETFRKTVSRMD
jgi:AraC-like DNA-binding protein